MHLPLWLWKGTKLSFNVEITLFKAKGNRLQNKSTTNHVKSDQLNSLTLNNTPAGGGNVTGVLIDVLGDLGGESTNDPTATTNEYSSSSGGMGRLGGGGGGGLGLGLESIVGSGVPEDNFNK